jgi:hypothetical protein
MTEEPKLGIRRTPSGMHALGKVEYEIKDGEVVYKPGGTVGVMLTESHVGTSEPTLRDLSEGLIAVYGTDYGINSPTWITRFTDMTRQAAAGAAQPRSARRLRHHSMGESGPADRRPTALGAVPAPAAVLIRPDGYTAWVGDGTDTGLRDALTAWFGSP